MCVAGLSSNAGASCSISMQSTVPVLAGQNLELTMQNCFTSDPNPPVYIYEFDRDVTTYLGKPNVDYADGSIFASTWDATKIKNNFILQVSFERE